jgi:signal peptidase
MSKILGTIGVAVLFALAAIMIVPALLGFNRYVIVSGSMTGTYDRGSIVYDREVPVSDLGVGDTITYAPPAGSEDVVTHRLYRITRNPDGNEVFQTKGDANATPDPWHFTLDQAKQDRVAFSIPYVGYAFAALGDPRLRLFLLGVPAVVIALMVLVGIWRQAGEELRRREAGIPQT